MNQKKGGVLLFVALVIVFLSLGFFVSFMREGSITGAAVNILPVTDTLINGSIEIVNNGSKDFQNDNLADTSELFPSNEVNTRISNVGILAAANASRCGDVNQSITLVSNITASNTCFIINSSNIVLDGAGFSVIGSGSGFGVGFNLSGLSNVTVQNIRFNNFSIGLNISNSQQVLLKNITIHTTINNQSTFYGIFAYNVTPLSIDNLSITITSNLSFGMYIISSDFVNISNSTIALSSINGNTSSYAIQGIAILYSNLSKLYNNNITITPNATASIATPSVGINMTNVAQSNVSFNSILLYNSSEGITIGGTLSSLNNVHANNITLRLGGSPTGAGIRIMSIPLGSFLISNTISVASSSDGVEVAGNGSYIEENFIKSNSGATFVGFRLVDAAANNTFLNNYAIGGREAMVDDTENGSINYLIFNNSFGEIRWINDSRGFLDNLDVKLLNFGSPVVAQPNGRISITNGTLSIDIQSLKNTSIPNPLVNSSVNVTLRSLSLSALRGIQYIPVYAGNYSEITSRGTSCNGTICGIINFNSVSGVLQINATELGSFAPTDNPWCGALTTNVTLTENVSSPGGSCFTVRGDNIQLDCAGYTIQGRGEISRAAIQRERVVSESGLSSIINNVPTIFTVKNCRISGFERGIVSSLYRWNSTGTLGLDAGVTNLNITWNLTDNIIFNTTIGLDVVNEVNILHVSNNTIYNTTLPIRFIANSVDGVVEIINNYIHHNSEGLDLVGDPLIFKANNLSHNKEGIKISSRSTFRDNYYVNNTKAMFIFSNSNISREQFINNTYAIFGDITTSSQTGSFFINSTFSGNQWDIYANTSLSSSNPHLNITLVNATSVNYSKIKIGNHARVHFKWFVDVNITDQDLVPVNGSRIRAFNSLGKVDANNGTTNEDGFARIELLEKYISGDTFYYLTPFKVEASKNNYTHNKTSLNLLNQTHAFINLSINYIICGSSISANLDLGNNYNCNQNAFTAETEDIVINGNNYNITGQNGGLGLIVINKNNVSIHNLGIHGFSVGLYIDNSNNSNITQLTITNNDYAVIINNSYSNSLQNSVLGNSTFSRVLALSNRNLNNSLVNISTDFNNISISGSMTLYKRWYSYVNISLNTTANPDDFDLIYSPIAGALISSYFNSSGVLDSSVFSSDVGLGILELTEQTINSSGITTFTPHNISVIYTYVGSNFSNSTVINVSLSNNTFVNLSVGLNCTSPFTTNSITTNTNYCPGTYGIAVTIDNDGVSLNCAETVLKPNADVLTISGRQNIVIDSCAFDGNEGAAVYGITVDSSSQNITLKNLKLNGYFEKNSIFCDSSNLIKIINTTFSITNGDESILLEECNNSNISLNYLGGENSGVKLLGSNNNTFINNTFTGEGTGVYIDASSASNSFFYNVFTDLSENYQYYATNLNYFNTTVSSNTRGNEYSDYCDKGVDLNSDGYADNFTSLTNRDWPYNKTVAGSKIVEADVSLVDNGPRIISCPPSQVFLGSSDSGGSSSPAAAASSAPAPAPAPSDTGTSRTPLPPPPPPEESYSASEAQEFLERQVTTQDLHEKVIKVTVILENTGTKKMLLFPELLQQSDDPFYIVTRKTLGTEGSLFSKISSLSYSPDPVAGRLLKATIINPEQVILNPGEKIEKVLEIEEGLIPRQLKIQFTTLGETVFEEEVQVQKKAFSGTAIDIDTQNTYLDIYAVIVPEELTKELEEYYAGSPSGAAIAQTEKDLNDSTIKDAEKESQNEKAPKDIQKLNKDIQNSAKVEDKANGKDTAPTDNSKTIPPATIKSAITEELENTPKKIPVGKPQKRNFVGFAQQVLQQFTPSERKLYQLELGLYEPGSSEAFFTDLYGPYDLKENQTFIFAQQLKYNPKVYAGNYDLKTKIYRGQKLLVENKFEVNLGEAQPGMLWPWVSGQIVLIALGTFAYMHIKKHRQRLRKAME